MGQQGQGAAPQAKIAKTKITDSARRAHGVTSELSRTWESKIGNGPSGAVGHAEMLSCLGEGCVVRVDLGSGAASSGRRLRVLSA